MQLAAVVLLALALGGCAALARFPQLCIEQHTTLTEGEATEKGIDQIICVGPEREGS